MGKEHIWSAQMVENSCIALILALDGADRVWFSQCGKTGWAMSVGKYEKVRQDCGSHFQQEPVSVFSETLAKHPCSGLSPDALNKNLQRLDAR